MAMTTRHAAATVDQVAFLNRGDCDRPRRWRRTLVSANRCVVAAVPNAVWAVMRPARLLSVLRPISFEIHFSTSVE
jgi:hypothetical protein